MQAYSFYRILNDARQLTRLVDVSLAEMLFVFSHAKLTEVEKILWLTLAAHADRETFSCTFSYAQLSYCISEPHENVHRALTRLIAMGFIETTGLLDSFTPLTLLKVCTFTVLLPSEGLLALKKTSLCAAKTATQDRPPRRPVTINLLNNRIR